MNRRSREGAAAEMTTRDAAVGEGPLGAARWVGAGGAEASFNSPPYPPVAPRLRSRRDPSRTKR